MNTKPLFAILLLASLQAFVAGDDPPECSDNEVFSQCGNLCEDSCSNTCDAPIFQSFATMNPTNPDCEAGCYCKNGYIRNDDGDCVLNVPGVCSTDRCGIISANAVYKRCVSVPPPACFKRPKPPVSSGYTGRCVCRSGYSMNSLKKCVKTGSKACTSEKQKLLKIFYMQTPYDC